MPPDPGASPDPSPHPDAAPTGPRWVAIAGAGALAGFTSGLFGVGGGIIIVPALTLLAGFDPKRATATSLSAIVGISLAGLVGYAGGGAVDWAYALPISVGALGGALLGTRWLRAISGQALQVGFAVLMVLTALRLLTGEGDGAGRLALALPTGVGLVVLGLAAGALAGLLGVGGGVIIVPALTLAFGLTVVDAKGTSLAVIVPTAVLGTVRNRAAGLADLRPAAVVAGAGIASAYVASLLSLGLDPELSARLFAALLLLVAVRLVVEARGLWHLPFTRR